MDAAKIGHVLRNLLGNAIKFTPENSRITVSCAQAESPVEGKGRGRKARFVSGVQVTVSDEGPGVPEDELESIFDEFAQSSKTKSNAGGTGLGLAICRKIVQGHNGRIWAENNKGRGAKIQFFLPLPVERVPEKSKNVQ